LKSSEESYEEFFGYRNSLYCHICFKFDCKLHGMYHALKVDNYESYNLYDYLNTYSNMLKFTNNIFKGIKESSKDIDLVSALSYLNEVLLKIITNNKCFNKLLDIDSESNTYNNRIPCDDNCFLNIKNITDQEDKENFFSHILYNKYNLQSENDKAEKNNDSNKDNINADHNNNKRIKVFQFYLDKCFKTFKFNPCAISRMLLIIAKEQKHEQEFLEKMNCISVSILILILFNLIS
jgi:hypothetical protein